MDSRDKYRFFKGKLGSGFTTAAGKGIIVSSEATTRAKVFFAEDFKKIGRSTGGQIKLLKDEAIFSRFISASKKSVQASEEAKSLGIEDQSEIPQAVGLPDHSESIKGSKPDQKETLVNVTKCSHHQGEEPKPKPVSGFVAAPGTYLQVSEDAMTGAQSLWKDTHKAHSGENDEVFQWESKFSVNASRSASEDMFAEFTSADGAAVKGTSFQNEGNIDAERRIESLKPPKADTNTVQAAHEEEHHCKRRRLQPVLSGESPEASERNPLASKSESTDVEDRKEKTASTFKPRNVSAAHNLNSASTLKSPHFQSAWTCGSSSRFLSPGSGQSLPAHNLSTSWKTYPDRGGGGTSSTGQMNSVVAARESLSEQSSTMPSGADDCLFDMDDEEENRSLCELTDSLVEELNKTDPSKVVALDCETSSSCKLQTNDSKWVEHEGRAKSGLVREEKKADAEMSAGCTTSSIGAAPSDKTGLPAQARKRPKKLSRLSLRKNIQLPQRDH
ncbi:uncharacterized protein LOC101846652 [Aplysia californica]|uniref:Uncharacterized protein LOC101846652 n=1 Tax=Aplysia californica TaxID=6500 RepID=A0ABM1A003_APLCA|nr:uncharacterized protein LOC101846652 [Aplysia californica]